MGVPQIIHVSVKVPRVNEDGKHCCGKNVRIVVNNNSKSNYILKVMDFLILLLVFKFFVHLIDILSMGNSHRNLHFYLGYKMRKAFLFISVFLKFIVTTI